MRTTNGRECTPICETNYALGAPVQGFEFKVQGYRNLRNEALTPGPRPSDV